ncbi:hypothetical protein LINPERHAP2_LOCUS40246 [Linum perenne]
MALNGDEAPTVQFTATDLQDARERTELSLLARIFWDEPRDLWLVENSIPVWKCGRVRIFYVGFGLYQFIFPSVSKRNFVLANQPWFFQRAIIHFSNNMTHSEELFDSLQFMLIWVKIIGMSFACRTIAIGRKLLEPMGEVVRMGYFDAHKPEGCYVKGQVRMDLFSSFLGTAPTILSRNYWICGVLTLMRRKLRDRGFRKWSLFVNKPVGGVVVCLHQLPLTYNQIFISNGPKNAVWVFGDVVVVMGPIGSADHGVMPIQEQHIEEEGSSWAPHGPYFNPTDQADPSSGPEAVRVQITQYDSSLCAAFIIHSSSLSQFHPLFLGLR